MDTQIIFPIGVQDETFSEQWIDEDLHNAHTGNEELPYLTKLPHIW